MGYGIKEHHAGSLYVTIAIPQAEQSPPAEYLSYMPEDFNTSSYETYCAEGYGREEFDWGLYWHRDTGDGIWYGLEQREDTSADGLGLGMRQASITTRTGKMMKYTGYPIFSLSRHEMQRSPRLYARVVGLIRVVHVPPSIVDELTTYLDWLTAHAAVTATRSFIWAASLFLRAHRHAAAVLRGAASASDDCSVLGFDINGFLWEALEFGYGEVWYALAGQLPRPILVSTFAVDVSVDEMEGCLKHMPQSVVEEAKGSSNSLEQGSVLFED